MTKPGLPDRVMGDAKLGAKLGERAVASAGKSQAFGRTPCCNRLVN